ncbi:MAG: autotransporter domain-containing protein [Planctomycetaceae bacterium]|nr:autotransporter domain-containing protein [Planctomycetaceae bacterium]
MDISGKNIVVNVGFGHEGILNTLTNTVTIDNVDVQSGHIAKIGDGTLIFTGNDTNLSNGTVYVKAGTLQLGDNTAEGHITASGGFDVSAGAFLAYDHSNDITESQQITGAGTVIQRGTGTLKLSNDNNALLGPSGFLGGTIIESGTVEIADSLSYGSSLFGGPHAGHITFTGDQRGDAVVTGVSLINFGGGLVLPILSNSFRTEEDSTNNYVDFTNIVVPPGGLMDMPIIASVPDGAFHVATNSEMTVSANHLILGLPPLGLYNGPGGAQDLYVAEGGKFNLQVAGYGNQVTFGSGIAGSGDLHISASGAHGMVNFNRAGADYYKMGNTTIAGKQDHIISLTLGNGVVFENEGDFILTGDRTDFLTRHGYGTATLIGSGTVKADTIKVLWGAGLAPTGSTLTLEANTVELQEFVMVFQGQMLSIKSDDASIGHGIIGITDLTQSQFRLMETTHRFTNAQTNADLNTNDLLRATSGGYLITSNPASPRGHYSFKFGDEFAPKDDPLATDLYVWLANDMNSLTMGWNGETGTALNPIFWIKNDAFESLQTGAAEKEHLFLAGDKVYFFGADDYFIDIVPVQLENTGDRIAVSGMVVGREMDDSTITAGNFTFSGAGGLYVDASKAFGEYLPGGSKTPTLTPTGKLEKYGSGTLTFENTNNNYFAGGMSVQGGGNVFFSNGGSNTFGGDVSINNSNVTFDNSENNRFDGAVNVTSGKLEFTENVEQNQFKENVWLAIGGTLAVTKSEHLLFDAGKEIQFTGDNATLQANGVVATDAPVTINTFFTSIFDTPNADNALLLNGALSMSGGLGNPWIDKTGAGILQIGVNSNVENINTHIVGGEFRVVDGVTYDTRVMVVGAAGTLAGGGTVKGSNSIEVGGILSPDSYVYKEEGGKLVVESGNQYGTLTLDSNRIFLGDADSLWGIPPFTMNFDVDAKSDGKDDLKDLLILVGNTTMVNSVSSPMNGTINFRGSLINDPILVIKSEMINGYNLSGGTLNTALTATLNGAALTSTPRGTYAFKFGDDAGTPANFTDVFSVATPNIWLESHLNSLTMNWTGGGTVLAPVSGYWGYDSTFVSQQLVGGNSESVFHSGDYVLLYNPNDDGSVITVTLSNPDDGTPMDARVSRLTVGYRIPPPPFAMGEQHGNVTINGTGSIYADASLAFGDYLLLPPADPERLYPTGTLDKWGEGILKIDNEGANFFVGGDAGFTDRGGVNINGGTIVIGENSFDKTTGLSQALGYYVTSPGSTTDASGRVRFFYNDDTTVEVEDVAGVDQRIQNYFQTASSIKNKFINHGELEISGVENHNDAVVGIDGLGGAFFIDATASNSSLDIVAMKHLTLKDNKFYYPIPDTWFFNDILLDGSVSGTPTLNLLPEDGTGIFIQSGIATTGRSEDAFINIAGDGFVQIEADSAVNGTTNVTSTLRIADGITYGSPMLPGTDYENHTVNVSGRLEGAGTLRGHEINFLGGTISPDNLAGTPVVAASSIGVLTLAINEHDSGLGPHMVNLADFIFEYDVRGTNNDYSGPGYVSPNDLLRITGFQNDEVEIVAGTIKFQTANGTEKTLETGKYLIIDADSGIAGTLAGLTALINGNATDTTPRHTFDFRFNDDTKGEAALDNSQIWADYSVHSLTMDWTGSASSVWNTVASNFESHQGAAGSKEHVFRPGDYVIFGESDKVEIESLATLVSGVEIFLADTQAMTFTGSGGIYAREQQPGDTDIVGKYVGVSLFPTGQLWKDGEGTLIFENKGFNVFEEGIVLYGGKILVDTASADAIGFSQALGKIDGNYKLSGMVSFDGSKGGSRTVEIADGVKKIQNLFYAEDSIDNTFRNFDALEVFGVVHDPATLCPHEVGSGAFVVNALTDNAVLTIDAKNHLTLRDNGYAHADGFIPNDILLLSNRDGRATLNLNSDAAKGIFIQSGIADIGANNEINIGGAGFVQIEAMSAVSGTTNVLAGATLRILNEISYGNDANHAVNVFGALAGSGILRGSEINISGTISPDADRFSPDHTAVDLEHKYGIQTLHSTVGTTLNGFTFNYDIDAPNETGVYKPTTDYVGETTNDLLLITGDGRVELIDGTIHFRGGLQTGNYLIIASSQTINLPNGKELDGINNPDDGVLKAAHDNGVIHPNSPRGNFAFVFETPDKKAQDSQIWLKTEINSLTMKWDFDKLVSVQKGPGGETTSVFRPGDYLIFDTAASYNVAAPDTIVSGLDVGGDENVTFTGDGGFLARTQVAGDTDIIGRYLTTLNPDELLVPNGMLKKTGSGTLTFANTGGNVFSEGIELHGGTVAFDNANQLGDGGKGITFVDDAKLKLADAVSPETLAHKITINAGKTAEFIVDTNNALILTGQVSGGNVEKTGAGILQFSGIGSVNVADTDVSSGEMRILKDYTSDNFTVKKDAVLTGNGKIISSGTINMNADSILSPDNDAAKYGKFTFNGDTNLNGFIFEYDINPNGDNDLLVVESGAVNLNGGTIDFIGTLSTGSYLIMTSQESINTGGKPLDGINDPVNGVLSGMMNGEEMMSGLPRGEWQFVFEDDVLRNEIWLIGETNSLTMKWDIDKLVSVQQGPGGKTASVFRPGDYLIFETAASYNAASPDTVISGLDVGGNENVTFTGDGGFLARTQVAGDTDIIGRYLTTLNPDELLVPTGMLKKTGSGTLTFANTGGNVFSEGIELHGGTVAFDKANQLGDGGKGIKFVNTATLSALNSVTLGNAVNIADNATGSFDTGTGSTFTYIGELTGTNQSTLNKSGLGTVRLEEATSEFAGNVSVSAGKLFIAGYYGKTKQFDVENNATLAGTGTIGGIGTIKTGGTLMPGGAKNAADWKTNDYNPLYVNGSLQFDNGSIFDVHIARSASEQIRISDSIVVNGNVAIDSGAKLKVTVDYWEDAEIDNDKDHFTVIDASQEGGTGRFGTLEPIDLPRGLTILHGWDRLEDALAGNMYELWFHFDPTKGFGHLCTRHNRKEIGKTLDWFTENKDPGLKDLIDQLSSFEDKEICELLDQLHGDLTPNAMFMALKEPWRSPFNRLSLDANSCSPCGPLQKKFKRELWGEFNARYENVGFDNNAHAFTINRYGIAVGVDQRLNRRSVIGAAFQYADPRLRQATGKVEMDDYEFGIYNMTRLTDNVDAKLYLGYSHQSYEFSRRVFIPANGKFTNPISEQFSGRTNGDAFAASVEIIRTMKLRNGFRLLPVAALDFERAWMRGYQESGKQTTDLTALTYNDASLERYMFRIGLGGEYDLRNQLTLNGRVQYAAQLNDREYPAVGTRFVHETKPGQRTADIWGSKIGRDYWNLGIGANWKLNNSGSKSLYINYDGKLYNRATVHAGEAGFVRKW